MSSNRRHSRRVNTQIPVGYQCGRQEHEGVTLNLSEDGARVVLRHAVPTPFRLTLNLDRPVSVLAYPVWEQTLLGGGRVMGLRFGVTEGRREIRAWIERHPQAAASGCADVPPHRAEQPRPPRR